MLEETVKKMQVNPQNLWGNLQELEEETELLMQAGFRTQARHAKARMILARVKKALGNAIVLQPPFDGEGWGHWTGRLLLHKESKGLFGSNNTYLYEVRPSNFKGNIPKTVLRATVHAKQLGLGPRVWFVAKENQFREYLAIPRGDPAIVGYPAEWEGSRAWILDHQFAVLIGLWGKDIAEISRVFEEK